MTVPETNTATDSPEIESVVEPNDAETAAPAASVAPKAKRPAKKRVPRRASSAASTVTPTEEPEPEIVAEPETVAELEIEAVEQPAAELEPFAPVEEKPLTVTQEFRAFIEPQQPAELSLPTGIPSQPELPALATLDARSISAWFGDRKVLDRVDLTMEAGKVTALIGPSGCGKSTFLRILNRMHEMIPSASLAGEVLLDGEDIYSANRRLTAARREIGMVFQKPNPFPAMSIYDNVIAGLKLTGTRANRDEKDLLVESSLTKAGLWKEVRDRLRQPGGGLSGGQQQRLCIARSLAVRPRVLLMDEPCSALDPTSTRVIEETMLELAHEVTIVIVTHNMQQAQRVSDNCAFFLAAQGTPGAIVEQGDTKMLFESPIDPRTHDYVNGRFG